MVSVESIYFLYVERALFVWHYAGDLEIDEFERQMFPKKTLNFGDYWIDDDSSIQVVIMKEIKSPVIEGGRIGL